MIKGTMNEEGIYGKRALIFSLVVVAILTYIAYGQWASRTNMYMKSHKDLLILTGGIRGNIFAYLEYGDSRYLTRASEQAHIASMQAGIFEFYYPNQLGYELTNNLQRFFYNLNIQYLSVVEPDSEALRINIEDLNKLIDTLLMGDSYLRYASRHSLFPHNPYNKSKARDILKVTKEILNGGGYN